MTTLPPRLRRTRTSDCSLTLKRTRTEPRLAPRLADTEVTFGLALSTATFSNTTGVASSLVNACALSGGGGGGGRQRRVGGATVTVPVIVPVCTMQTNW